MASAGIRKTPTGRYKVWWRLDDASQGSQTFDTRDAARDFKHDLLARLARGELGRPAPRQADLRDLGARVVGGLVGRPRPQPRPPCKPPRAACAATCCRSSASDSSARSPSAWCAAGRTNCAARVGYDTVMACRSLLNRILQAAEDDRRIDANPVRKVPAPRPPVDADARSRPRQAPLLHPRGVRAAARRRPARLPRPLHLPGRNRPARRGAARPARPPGRPRRRRLEVLEVRYEAGRFGRGYKDRPKSATSIRVIPLAGQVADAIARQLPDGCPPSTLVFAGPGGGNGVPAGTRTAAVPRQPAPRLPRRRRPGRRPDRHPGLHPAAGAAGAPRRRSRPDLRGDPQPAPRPPPHPRHRPRRALAVGGRPAWRPGRTLTTAGRRAGRRPTRHEMTPSTTSSCAAPTTCGTPSRPGWRTPASLPE